MCLENAVYISEYKIHESLESRRRIGQAHGHDTKLEQPQFARKRCISTGIFGERDLIIPGQQVELRAVFGLGEQSKNNVNHRQRICVFDGNIIQQPEVDGYPQRTVGLLDQVHR